MTFLLRSLSMSHFRTHALRTLLTVIGVAVGVAATIGIRALNSSVTRSFEDGVSYLAGRAALQIANGSAGIPEILIDTVSRVPGVAVAAPSVQGFLPVSTLPGERLFVIGLDLLQKELSLHALPTGPTQLVFDDPLEFVTAHDSIALTDKFLRENDLSVGDSIEVVAAGDALSLTVRGVLDTDSGPAKLFDGRVAIMDMSAAQNLFGMRGRFTQIDVEIQPTAQLFDVQSSLILAVGSTALVETPKTRSASLANLIQAHRTTFSLGAFVATALGFYVIMNAMAITVAQRWREIALLRCIGATRKQMSILILSETAALGTLGCLLGIPLGHSFATLAASPYMASLASRFVASPHTTAIPEHWGSLGIALLGVIGALIAAIVPIRAALRIPPILALRTKTLDATLFATNSPRSCRIAIVLFLLSLIIWSNPDMLPMSAFNAGLFAVLGLVLALAFAAPTLLSVMLLPFYQPLSLSTTPTLLLACRRVSSYLPRITLSGAALVIGVAGALCVAALISTLDRSMSRVLQSAFSNVDLAVGSATNILANDWGPLPEALAHEIATVEGVLRVAVEQWTIIPYDGLRTNLVARDPTLFRDSIRRLDLIEGNSDSAIREMATERAVVVSMVFSNRFNKHLGDWIALRTPTGVESFRIAGVHYDMQDLGIIFIDRATYRALWRDDNISFIIPILARNANRSQIATEIRQRWAAKFGLFVLTIADLRHENARLLADTINAAHWLVAAMLFATLLGVSTSLVTAVLDRRDEICLLRTLGATRGYVTRLTILESTVVGVIASALGIVAGSLMGYVVVTTLFPNVFSITPSYQYPGKAVALTALMSALFSPLVGYFPARWAARAINTRFASHD